MLKWQRTFQLLYLRSSSEYIQADVTAISPISSVGKLDQKGVKNLPKVTEIALGKLRFSLGILYIVLTTTLDTEATDSNARMVKVKFSIHSFIYTYVFTPTFLGSRDIAGDEKGKRSCPHEL